MLVGSLQTRVKLVPGCRYLKDPQAQDARISINTTSMAFGMTCAVLLGLTALLKVWLIQFSVKCQDAVPERGNAPSGTAWGPPAALKPRCVLGAGHLEYSVRLEAGPHSLPTARRHHMLRFQEVSDAVSAVTC